MSLMIKKKDLNTWLKTAVRVDTTISDVDRNGESFKCEIYLHNDKYYCLEYDYKDDPVPDPDEKGYYCLNEVVGRTYTKTAWMPHLSGDLIYYKPKKV